MLEKSGDGPTSASADYALLVEQQLLPATVAA